MIRVFNAEHFVLGLIVGVLWLVSLGIGISLYGYAFITYPFVGDGLGFFAALGGVVNLFAALIGFFIALGD